MHPSAADVSALPASAPAERSTVRPAASVWLLIGILGTILNAVAYQSWQPMVVALALFGSGYMLLLLTPLGGAEERLAFRASAATAWCAAGIAALYLVYRNDPVQLDDADDFFVLASSASASLLQRADLYLFTSGAGAVVLWRQFYEFFSELGFERGRFIGITVNSLAMAMNGVVAVKIAREAFGPDSRRLRRLPYLVALCGVFAMFASVHLRDALVVLSITTIGYFWVRYLARANTVSLLLVIAATGASTVVLPLLRTEFLFVPVAMTIAGAVAILLFDPKENGRRTLVISLIAIGVLALANLLIAYGAEMLFLITTGISNYSRTSATESAAGSLGSAIILSAPYPMRILLGSVYLYAFPIPVWTGFQLKSAYYLFTSFTALYFYVTMPLVLVALPRVFRGGSFRTPPLTFLAFCVLGFTVAIAGTSIETRHLGAFLVFFQVLALVPDLRDPSDRSLYLGWLRLIVGAAVAVHVAWAMLKFIS